MNVLIIGNNPKIAKQFSLFSDNIFMIVPSVSGTSNRLSSEMNDYSLIYSDFNPSKISGFLRRKNEIKRVVMDNNIDVVFSNRKDDMVAAKLATNHLKHKPILLVTFHNSLAWTNAKKVKLLSLLIDRNADGCICLAHLSFDQLENNKMKRTKLLYLPNTIEFENIIKKDKYELQNNTLNLCYVGVVVPNKNQLFLLKTINEINKEIDVHLDIFGDFIDLNYQNELSSYIAMNSLEKNVTLKGGTDYEFIKINLCKYDAYFSATTIEMSPYNILEAKAAALPIVASNVHGQRDLITDKLDGLLYTPENVGEAKKLLLSVFEDKQTRENLGKNAFEDVSAIHSYLVSAKKLEDFIKKLK